MGATINCEGVPLGNGTNVKHPHVQSYMAATDKVGLDTIRKAGALDCHEERMDAIVNGELGLSRAVL